MIKIENINLTFNNEVVLNDINYSIDKGENICFWGSSGSGKSSLMKILNGIIVPQSGKILVDGIELTKESVNEIRNKISWIPQDINLPVDNSDELIELLLLNDDQIVKFSSYAKKLGLIDVTLKKSFQEISGGQKQRIVIASILALNKPILLLDEPTSALDADSVTSLINLIYKDLDFTVISASHDKQWSDASDRVLKLS